MWEKEDFGMVRNAEESRNTNTADVKMNIKGDTWTQMNKMADEIHAISSLSAEYMQAHWNTV